VLPDITSHPSLVHDFGINRRVLPEGYRRRNDVYGLMNYIKSLSKVAQLNSKPFKATFPAHRLFYNGRFNLLDSSERAKEVIKFHIDRCRDILGIIDNKPAGVSDIAVQHFPSRLLAGFGRVLAENEIRAHIEILEACGDIQRAGENRDIVQRTGTSNYLKAIEVYLHCNSC
jgi:hypothetical protein